MKTSKKLSKDLLGAVISSDGYIVHDDAHTPSY